MDGDAPDLRDGASLAGEGDRLTRGPVRAGSLLKLPRLTLRAVQLVWRAARTELLAYVAIQVVAAASVGLVLVLGQQVLREVLAGADGGGDLHGVSGQLIALGALSALIGFASGALGERRLILAELVERLVQGHVIETVSAVELEAFEDPDFHDRLQRARFNAGDRSWEVTFGLVSMSYALVGVLAVGLVLMRIHPPVVPVLLLAYVPLWLATTRNSRASYAFEYALTATDRERAYLNEVLTGKSEAKEIRLFGLSDFLRARHDSLYDRRIRELRRVVRQRMRRSLLGSAGVSLVTLLGLTFLINLTLAGEIDPAEAGIAAVALQQMGTRLRSMDASIGALLGNSLFLEDLITFLDLEAAVMAERPSAAAPSAFHRLKVDHASFRYPGTDRVVLHDLCLEVGAGEVVALVGENGSGKTTLAKILCGLYSPTAGRVLWDDVDVTAVDPTALRRGITAIFQDFVHYELSAQDNVGLGRHEHLGDLDSIRAAARRAGIDEVLSGLPAGYATRLSRSFEGGTELSTGEWQRVSLARAFFRNAPFIVLDEPTASLDARSEQELFERIRSLQRGRAVLLISHRFSSVRTADRIYVLDHGRVVEEGSHADLLNQDGRYARMFAMQAAAYQQDPTV